MSYDSIPTIDWADDVCEYCAGECKIWGYDNDHPSCGDPHTCDLSKDHEGPHVCDCGTSYVSSGTLR